MSCVYIASITCMASEKKLPVLKIGVSSNPRVRMKHLNGTLMPVSSSVEAMFLFKSEVEAYRVERICHLLMGARRVNGEWFSIEDADKSIADITKAIGLLGGITEFSLIQGAAPTPKKIVLTASDIELDRAISKAW